MTYGDPVLLHDAGDPCPCGLPHTLTPAPPPGCPSCHRLADAVDVFRQANDRLIDDIARLNREVARLTQRYEGGRP